MEVSFQVDWDSRKQVWTAWAHQAVGHDWLEASADDPVQALRDLLEKIAERETVG